MKYNITFCMYHIITGGIENILLNVLDELSKYDKYNISVVSLEPVTEKKFLDFFEVHNIKLIIINTYIGAPRPKNFFKRKFQYFKRYLNGKKIQKLFKTNDLLIDYFNGMFFNLFKKTTKCKKILFPHCSVKSFMKNKDKNIKIMLNTYDKIVCISKSFYDDMIIRYPKYKEKFIHIYNPVNIQDITTKTLENIPELKNKKYFTSVARLSTDKDHFTLFNAFARFLEKENYPDVYLYILGTGPLLEKWQSLCKSLQIDDKVVFCGNVSNPPAYVKGAIANVLSTFGEGLPTVLIESQIAKTLNIASNVECGISEILLNGSVGILFESENSEDLSNKMSDVYHNRINKNEMINKSFDALDRFDKKQICKKLDSLFEEIICRY